MHFSGVKRKIRLHFPFYILLVLTFSMFRGTDVSEMNIWSLWYHVRPTLSIFFQNRLQDSILLDTPIVLPCLSIYSLKNIQTNFKFSICVEKLQRQNGSLLF